MANYNSETLKVNNKLDYVKFIFSLLILASHALPIFENKIDFYFGQWFFRPCVPLFFISSGFFFFKMNNDKKVQYIKRIGFIYALLTVLYMPLWIKNATKITFIYNIIFGYSHLWYLSALFFGLIIIYFISKVKKDRKIPMSITLFTIGMLLIIGVIYDEYIKLFKSNDYIKKSSMVINVLGGGRGFLFMGLPLLLVGYFIGSKKDLILKINPIILITITIFAFVLSLLETIYLGHYVGNITKDCSIFNYLVGLGIFLLTFYGKQPPKVRKLRKMADLIYFIHPYFIYLIRKFINCNGILNLFFVVIISIIASAIILLIQSLLNKKLVSK